MMSTVLDAAVCYAVRERAARSTVPFVVIQGDRAEVFGSGVLVRAGGEGLILTAAHVAEHFGSKDFDVGIPSARAGGPVHLPGNTFHRANSQYDVAIIRLEDRRMTNLLDQGWSFLDAPDVVKAPSVAVGQAVFVYGHPTQLTVQVGDELQSEAFAYLSRRIEVDPSECPTEEPFDSDVDFMIDHVPVNDGAGQPLRLQGISGCGIWAVQLPDPQRNPSVWSAEKDSGLIAIETGYKRGRYIRAKTADAVLRMLPGLFAGA